MDTASRLRAARIEAGLTQTALARDICALSYVSHLEAGRREPSDLILRKFEERLGLASGALQAASSPASTTGAHAGALLAQAQEHLSNGAYSSAHECASQARSAARAAGETGTEWLALKCLVDAAIGLGADERALALAEELITLANDTHDVALSTRSLLTASGVHYLFGDMTLAQAHSQQARTLARQLAPGHPLRTKALCAIINANPKDEQAVIELNDEFEHLGDTHIQGSAAWVLGNHAFHAGRIDEGLTLHNRAYTQLSPAADYRNWGRFLRSTVTERLKAGTRDGVESLLPQAHHALEILGNPDEVALLAGAEARLALMTNHPERVSTLLEPHLSEKLPELTRAELLALRAQAHRDIGSPTQATADALRAAKLFTTHGRLTEATNAWALADVDD